MNWLGSNSDIQMRQTSSDTTAEEKEMSVFLYHHGFCKLSYESVQPPIMSFRLLLWFMICRLQYVPILDFVTASVTNLKC